MLPARDMIGSHDILFVTLDTLRYDVAQQAMESGLTPNLERVVPGGKWELRHSPSTFTYAAHHAFFGGFLPTPVEPGNHPRLFAAEFKGSETTTPNTATFDSTDIVSGMADRGYRTICIGGTGFFSKRNPLSCVLPGLFQESYWSQEIGVTSPDSTEKQVECAVQRLQQLDQQRVFLFVNISALHQPNCIFTDDASDDSPQTQANALAYVDTHLDTLFRVLQQRGDCLCVICSDHGTCYGEGGYVGHRVSHPVVLNVPYAEFVLPRRGGQ